MLTQPYLASQMTMSTAVPERQATAWADCHRVRLRHHQVSGLGRRYPTTGVRCHGVERGISDAITAVGLLLDIRRAFSRHGTPHLIGELVKGPSAVIARGRAWVVLQWSLDLRTKSPYPLSLLRRSRSNCRGLGSEKSKRFKKFGQIPPIGGSGTPPKIGNFRSIDTTSIVTPRAVASECSYSIAKVAHRGQWINQ